MSVVFKQTSTTTDDGTGNRLPTVATYLSTTGVFWQLRGDERMVGGQNMVIASHIIALDYSITAAAITEKMTATIGSTVYKISYVENPGQLNNHIEVYLMEYRG